MKNKDIFETQLIIPNTPTKDDLRSGMKVLLSDGTWFTVIMNYFRMGESCLISEGGYIPFSQFNEDLSNKIDDLDIIEIRMGGVTSDSLGEFIWRRDGTIKGSGYGIGWKCNKDVTVSSLGGNQEVVFKKGEVYKQVCGSPLVVEHKEQKRILLSGEELDNFEIVKC